MNLKNMTFKEKMNAVTDPNISEDILREFSKAEDPWFRRTVAENPEVSGTLLVLLFEHEKSLKPPHVEVIQALYKNENLPTFAKRVIETLFGDML